MSLIDCSGILEIFLITNGRSTFEYANKAIEYQRKVNIKTTVIKNKPWVEANNLCVEQSESLYFLRVDDDMFLHPDACWYIFDVINRRTGGKSSHIAMMIWKLWELWTNRAVNGIKAYNTACVKEMGGFKANRLGKIDNIFSEKLRKSKKYSLQGDKSIVGIHAASKYDEAIEYCVLRGEDKGRGFAGKQKRLRKMNRYSGDMEAQMHHSRKGVWRKNKRSRSNFYLALLKNSLR